MASNKRGLALMERDGQHSQRLLLWYRYLPLRPFVFVVCASTLLSCSTMGGAHDGLLERLAGRGPVTVSPLSGPTGNPYLAGNLLLSREMAASPELKGFIEHRGTPQALEVETSLFSPPVLTLYYHDAGEEFSLESSDTTWIIEGPFPLEDSKRRELGGISKDPARSHSGDAPIATAPEGGSNAPSFAEKGVTENRRENLTPQKSRAGQAGFESGPFANQHSDEAASPKTTDSAKSDSAKSDSTESDPAESDPFLGRLEEAYRTRSKKSSAQGFSSPSDDTKRQEALSRALQEGEPPVHENSPDSGMAPSPRSTQNPLAKAQEPPPFKPSFLPTHEAPSKEPATSSTTSATGVQAKPEATRGSEEEQFLRALAEKESTNKAEITPKGDLVHYVTLQGETLSNIARWYTFDRDNAKRLARINELKNPDQLSLGDIVIIPSYLVKNQRRLTESGLVAIQDRVQKTPTKAPLH